MLPLHTPPLIWPDPDKTRPRYVGRSNLMIGGILILQKRSQRTHCEDGRFAHLNGTCTSAAVESSRPFGSDPVFVTGSTLNKLFNPTGQVSKADYYNETDPDYVNQNTKLPLGFHYLDDSANSGYSGFPVFLDTNLDSVSE